MRLITHPKNAATDSVRIALHLKNIEHELVNIQAYLDESETMSEHVRLCYQHHVPVIVDHQRVYVDTLAILEYLEEVYPEPTLLPGQARDRTQVRALAYLIMSNVYPFIKLLTDNDRQLRTEARNLVQAKAHDGFTMIESLIKGNPARGRLSFGDTPTLADVILAPQIWTAERAGLNLDNYPQTMQVYSAAIQLAEFGDIASNVG